MGFGPVFPNKVLPSQVEEGIVENEADPYFSKVGLLLTGDAPYTEPDEIYLYVPLADSTTMDKYEKAFDLSTYDRSHNLLTANSASYSLDKPLYGRSMFKALAGGVYYNSNVLQLPTTMNFTIEFWFATTDTTTSKRYLFGSGGTSNTTNGYFTIGYNFDATYKTYVEIRTANISYTIKSTTAINDGNLHHVAVTRSGLTYTMYLDGISVGTTTVASHSTIGSTTMYLGQATSNGTYFYIGQYVIYNKVKYTENFSVPTEPPKLFYNLNPLLNAPKYSYRHFTFGYNKHKYSGYFDTHNGYYAALGSYHHIVEDTEKPDKLVYKVDTGSNRIAWMDGTYYDNYGLYNNIGADLTVQWWVKSPFTAGSPAGTAIFNGRFDIAAYSNKIRIVNLAGAANLDFNDLSITPNTWAHCAVVVKNGVISAYVNGTKSATTYTNAINRIGGTSTYSLGMGSYQTVADNYITDFQFIGGAALYTSSFTVPDDIIMVPNTARGYVQSLKNAEIEPYIPYKTRVVSVPKAPFKDGRSLQFSGAATTEFNSGTPHPLTSVYTSNFTMEMWIYLKTITSNVMPFRFGSDFTANKSVFHYNHTNFPNKLAYFVFDYGDANNPLLLSNRSLDTNTWYHLCIERVGERITLYINGKEEDVGYTAVPVSTTNSIIQTGYSLNGYINSFRLTNGIARYGGPFAPPTKPLPTRGPA